MRTLNIRFMVTQSLGLRVCFHFQIKSVFQQLFFYQVHAKHLSPLRYSGKSFIIFILKIHIFFFKNPFCCVLIRKIFEEYWWLFLFKKRILVLEKGWNLDKVVIRDYTIKNQRACENRNETMRKFFFLFQTIITTQ